MTRVLRPGGRLAIAVWDALERSPGYAALAAMGNDLKKGILPLELPQHPVGTVARAVIDNYYFEAEAGRSQRLGAALDELGKVVRFVLRRNEYADVQRLDRSNGHTRFRIRAGRMPS